MLNRRTDRNIVNAIDEIEDVDDVDNFDDIEYIDDVVRAFMWEHSTEAHCKSLSVESRR